jgi:hypothetical protein
MARYRKTSNERVGRNVPVPSPTPSPTGKASSDIFSTINSRINNSMPDFADINTDVTIDEYLDSLSNTQLKVIGEMLRKARYTIKKVDDIKNFISQDFPGLALGSFNQFVTSLNEELVYKPSASTGPKESLSVTKYGPEQIDSWVDNWLTEEAGRGLKSITPDQAKVLRKAVKDYASGASVTTVTRDKKGRPVTTYQPAVTEAGIQETLQEAGQELFADEMERRKAFEFKDILNKTLGVGSI